MPRQISAALRTALLNPDPSKVKVFNMVHLDLETQPLYVHNDVGTVEWRGQSWTGLGDLGQVSEVVEDGVIAPGRFNLSLNGLKPEWLADARSERHMGRRADVYLAAVGIADGLLRGDPDGAGERADAGGVDDGGRRGRHHDDAGGGRPVAVSARSGDMVFQ